MLGDAAGGSGRIGRSGGLMLQIEMTGAHGLDDRLYPAISAQVDATMVSADPFRAKAR